MQSLIRLSTLFSPLLLTLTHSLSSLSLSLSIRFTALCDDLMATVLREDVNLHAELSADIQKELNLELNRLRAGQKIKDNATAKVCNTS